MKVLLYSSLVCLIPGFLLAQRGPAQDRTPIESEARGASARKSRNRSLSPALLEEYFTISDYNADGMVSFREAHKSLAISRAGFARYDTDRDGLINSEEFVTRYTEALVTGTSLPEPMADSTDDSEPVRNATQLRLAFDANADGFLDASEVETALTRYEQGGIDPQGTLERLDVDSSGSLELSELDGLVPILFRGDALGLLGRSEEEMTRESGEPAREIRSVNDLFGERVVRTSETKAAALPAQVIGPIDHFTRLDADQDGVLSFDDLDTLIRPIQSSIRLRAVIATLDKNEDGVVSRTEFWDSM